VSRDPSAALFARVGSYAKALPAVFAWLRELIMGPASYHPGAHYMRGEGPKCREKRDGSAKR
jgi:hypothetical protein